jgi:excinuclease ABC subunit C
VVAPSDTEHDIIGLWSDEVCSSVSVFFIRDGAVSDKEEFVFGSDRILDETNISSFICELYSIREYIPKSILLSFELEAEELETLSVYLTERAGRKVTVRTPERGENKTLCAMVRDNAAERAKNYRAEAEKDDKILLRLAELLSLETYPERIEAYDISNIGHEHITAGMIVTDGTKFKKSDYRSFKIGSVKNGTDDYQSMREALSRRLAHLNDESGSFSKLPDLILLDGGRGHVSVVRELMRELELDIPVFGMVKDDYHKTRALCTDTEEISIAKENALFVFIYKIQEEVHRFTVSKMDSAKRKTLTKPSLTGIEGIGDAKAKALLKHFGGIGKIKIATVEELAAVKGIGENDAKRIFAYSSVCLSR